MVGMLLDVMDDLEPSDDPVEEEELACICADDMAGTECTEERPEICTMEYVPVCGCDGIEYGNACGAL